jgi:hypothetical protein
MIVGSGDYRYEVKADWAKLPDGWSFKEVGGVGIDSNDNVYVFNRGDHPMMVFDREGNFCARGARANTRVRTASISRPTTRCSSPTPVGILCARSRSTATSCWS